MSSFNFVEELKLLSTFRRSILLVTPNESSFESIEETPDYTFEVWVHVQYKLIFDNVIIWENGIIKQTFNKNKS